MQHHIVSGSVEGRAALGQCVGSRCQSCQRELRAGELEFMVGRPVIARLLHTGVHYSLFACSHCTFKDLSWRPQKSLARFNQLNAPMDQDAACCAARMLGDTKEEYLVVIVV